MKRQRQLPTIGALGTAQTLAWASSYYLPAILAVPISHDLEMSTGWFFGVFSVALMLSGLIAPRVGRWIDISGGRKVLALSNVVFALGLVLLGAAVNMWQILLAWLLLGVGMGLGLYDAAFVALGRTFGKDARRAITGITLIADFRAQSVGRSQHRGLMPWDGVGFVMDGVPRTSFLAYHCTCSAYPKLPQSMS